MPPETAMASFRKTLTLRRLRARPGDPFGDSTRSRPGQLGSFRNLRQLRSKSLTEEE